MRTLRHRPAPHTGLREHSCSSVRKCHHANLGFQRFEGLDDYPRLRVPHSVQEPNDEARVGDWVGKGEPPALLPSPAYEHAAHRRSD